MAEAGRVLDAHFVELTKAFGYGEFSDGAGNKLHYRLYTPKLEAGQRYPLVIFLHGSGERGSDNELQVAGNRGAVIWSEPEEQAERPCYVLAPQAEADGSFTIPSFEAAFIAFLKQFLAENPVDAGRVYLTGLSMGGTGSWYYLCKYPAFWAAAAPIASTGDPTVLYNAKDIPMWTFHGVDDPFAPIEWRVDAPGVLSCGSRILGNLLRKMGGNVRSTEYPAGYIHERWGYPREVAGHAAWEPAYSSAEFRRWLFRQRKP